jgi:hypothetical protein
MIIKLGMDRLMHAMSNAMQKKRIFGEAKQRLVILIWI